MEEWDGDEFYSTAGGVRAMCSEWRGDGTAATAAGGEAFAWFAWSKASFWGTECAGGGDNGRQGRQAERHGTTG